MYGNDQSKHCYPGTDVLINFADLREPKQLEAFERMVTYQRGIELELSPMRGQFDFAHLCLIHRHLFSDIYPFAGQLRDEDIAKGSFRFASVEYIKPEADRLFQELKEENHLVGLSREQLPARLAHYMAELNVLHPFRDGNGRAQREFIRSLALRSGYQMDWSRVKPSEILSASIRSVVNSTDLTQVIDQTFLDNERNTKLMNLFKSPKKEHKNG